MQVSAEMRWFWREQCPADLEGWFFRLLPKAGGGVPRHDEYVPQDCCELGVKKRGSKVGLEVKGLIGTLRSPEILAFGAPYAELWCKWRVNDFPVDKSKSVVIEKFRWIRKLDTSDRTVREIPLGADELPLDRGPLPRQGCNLTLTKLKIAVCRILGGPSVSNPLGTSNRCAPTLRLQQSTQSLCPFHCQTEPS